MRTLLLLRHASAGNDPPGCSDHDRRLSAAGVQEAERLAEALAEREPAPSLVLCSSAQRTRETLAAIERRLPETAETQTSRELYLAGADELLGKVAEVDDRHAAVLVLGHDPGISGLAKLLTRSGDRAARSRMGRGFAPASLAVLALDLARWTEIRQKIAELIEFARPADLDRATLRSGLASCNRPGRRSR